MDIDDPRRPLLGTTVHNSRLRRTASKLCSVESWKRRLPITIWLPNYSFEYLLRDAIAGITVGLTSIPQGIAYAMVAGLPPQVGLYSSIFPGLVYMMFGSCKDVTVGPTAILAALLAKYVVLSADFAYLASFLSGCIILLLGVLQLGFLLDFISKPVITGFTTAAAMQISASQLKSLFRIQGKSGNTFIHAIINFFKNIKTVQLWDTVLGVCTIIALILLKRATIPVTDRTPPGRARFASIWIYVIRARNALVVFAAAIVAFILNSKNLTPFDLTGTIHGGLPDFGLPPFHTVINATNTTLDFDGMLSVFGAEGFVMPLVAILESIAIAKAFAGSATVDATQEMLAIGACNIVSSFCQSMPATGSFTRTAINHASGVVTPAGCFFKATLVLLAVTFLADAFYFIPRATLAGIIIMAMFSLMEFDIVVKLWRNNKVELLVYALTVVTGTCVGLEYGILCGAAADAVRALAQAARPPLQSQSFKVGNHDCVSITFTGALSYSSSQHVQERVRRYVSMNGALVVLDGRHLYAIDLGVVENLIAVILDLEKDGHRFLLWNFKESLQRLFADLHNGFESRFVDGPSIDQHVLADKNQVEHL